MTLHRVCAAADGTEREFFRRMPVEEDHLHERFELGFAPQSSFQLENGAHGALEVGPGSGYLVGPGVVHRLRPRNGAEDAPFHRMFLGPSMLGLLPREVLDGALRRPTLVDASRLRDVWQAAESAPVGPPSAPPVQRRIEHPGVERAMEHLQTQLHRGVSLDELSNVCALSKFHLCRLFHRVVGVTPRTFHRHIRVERGRHLLRTGRPSSRVASDLHFSDQSHFIRSFRRQFGATPGQFVQAMARPVLTACATAQTAEA